MKKRDWVIWLLTVLFLVFASTIPLRIYWKTPQGIMTGYRGTLFKIVEDFITKVFMEIGWWP